ncbi:MAG: HEPN domain-containing protein [bacterium]
MNDNQLAKEWFIKAEHDFSDAFLLFKDGGYADTICFLCHQAAEKCLKGFLFAKQNDYPRIHNLIVLLDSCVKYDKKFVDTFEDTKFLNKFYIEARYPINPPSMPSKKDAEKSISSAEAIMKIAEEYFKI